MNKQTQEEAETVWLVLRAIHECMKKRGREWIRWVEVARDLSIDPDLLAAWFDLPALRQFVKQDKKGRLVTLTPSALRATIKSVEEFEWVVPVRPQWCWVYYSYFKVATVDPLKLVLHDAQCVHCNEGSGHGGQRFDRVDPKDVGWRIPYTSWIGPFPDPSSAIQLCNVHPLIGISPERCGHCFSAH